MLRHWMIITYTNALASFVLKLLSDSSQHPFNWCTIGWALNISWYFRHYFLHLLHKEWMWSLLSLETFGCGPKTGCLQIMSLYGVSGRVLMAWQCVNAEWNVAKNKGTKMWAFNHLLRLTIIRSIDVGGWHILSCPCNLKKALIHNIYKSAVPYYVTVLSVCALPDPTPTMSMFSSLFVFTFKLYFPL